MLTKIFVFTLLVFFLLVRIVRRRARLNRKKKMLKACMQEADKFIGKDINYLVADLGAFSREGDYDRGSAVYQWDAGQELVEAWFQDRRCKSISLRKVKN